MDLNSFFRTVITAKSGWLCIAHAKIEDTDEKTTKSWTENFFSYPDELHVAINHIHKLGSEYDIYYSPYLFTEQKSTKASALVGRTIQADLDESNVLTIQQKPTILVETSAGRHQGYWILKDELTKEEHESLSKRLTYSIPRCDRSGWFISKKLRVPETYNHKYTSGPQYIRVVDSGGKVYSSGELQETTSPTELFGKSTPIEIDEENLEWANEALKLEDGPQELLSRIRSSVPNVAARYNLVQKDRSAALWALYMALFRAGLSKEKVLYLAYHSVNNKFKELRFGGIKELAKDVLRGELATKIQLPDVKSKIKDARKLGDSATDRSEYIARIVRDYLDKLGNFVHCSDDSAWYIREDIGRPVQLSSRSEHLLHMLDNLFGINGSEKESSYVNHSLSSAVADMPITGRLATLSHYDHEAKMFLLHTGRKNVLAVTPYSVTTENNGYGGIVFPWTLGNTAISPHYRALDRSWEDELFDDCLDNVMTIKKQNAKAILKIWLLSVLLRDGLSSRPILALFGQPGSGKSTLFRRVYALMYGRDKGLNTVTTEDHFDHAMSKDPLVVLDNVDTYAKWLPDRMAATVAPTEITKRKLFTDADTFVLRRQAMLGITAHNPKFGREDVTDRLLLLNFERLEHFKPENIIFDKIASLRNALWGAILQDIQTVMATEMPRSGYPQFRIEDFAQFGHWIATALGIVDEFAQGIDSIRQGQKEFNLEEDALLVSALEDLLKRETIVDAGAGQLWIKLRRYSKDEKGFDRKYGNAVSLGRKIWYLIDSLRESFDVEWKMKTGSRVWTITSRNLIEVGTNSG